MPVILDTHSWMWWVNGGSGLSRKARTAIDKALAQNDLRLSLISVWEVAKRVEKKQLVLDRSLDQWLDAATTSQGLQVLELTRSILVDACHLPPPFHGDPADQMIVATARHYGATLVTKDQKIRDYPHVRSVW